MEIRRQRNYSGAPLGAPGALYSFEKIRKKIPVHGGWDRVHRMRRIYSRSVVNMEPKISYTVTPPVMLKLLECDYQ